MNNFFKSSLIAFGVAALGVSAAVTEPDFRNVAHTTRPGAVDRLSDNGAWAVGHYECSVGDGTFTYPRLYNTETGELTWLYTAGEEKERNTILVYDVTNDGNTIVGAYYGRAAIYDVKTKTWEPLPITDSRYKTGYAYRVTPDGKYAVGSYTTDNSAYNINMVMWDLTGDEPKEVPLQLPRAMGMDGDNTYSQIQAADISDDGKKLIGVNCFSIMGETWAFIYDVDAKTWKAIGYEVDSSYNFTPTSPGYFFVENAQFIDDNTIAGRIYLAGDEYGVFSMDIATGKMNVLSDSNGMLYGAMDADGLFYASSPDSNPIRDWSVKMGDYWYDWKMVCRQIWGIDWQNDVVKKDYDLTGTLVSISKDGMTMIANDYTKSPYDNYVMRLPKPLKEILPQVNLLENYYVTPVQNASLAMMRTVKVTFDRDIEVLGKNASVQLLDEQGNVVANSIRVGLESGSTRVLSVAFRDRALEDGKKYTVVIPAGTVCIMDDAERKNAEIRATYKGRANVPVKVVKTVPESGSKVEIFNANSNPVLLTFDAEVAAPEENGGVMTLYRLNEANEREFVCKLNGSVTGNQLLVFPVMEQELANGTEYEIVVGANTVCDLSGVNGNEEYVIKYTGSFIPDGDPDQNVILSEDFSAGINGKNLMLYDGDQQEPNAAMKAWTFTADQPWIPVRDGESYDYAVASHSMYESPAQSDDWMVTKRLYLPDDTGVLTFQSQSYLKSKEDRLKVMVYVSDDVYTSLSKTIVDKIRYEGEVIYDEIQSPGKSEENLAGDWKDNVIELKKYAGKKIYIAFVNDNRNQSAIFIDNIKVEREIKVAISNMTKSSVVNQESTPVQVYANVLTQVEKYSGYELTLLDGEGKEIDKLAKSGLDIATGWNEILTFGKELPLTVGKETPYTINIKFINANGNAEDDEIVTINSTVKDLAMQTVKRVVIEKFTGQTCTNCPQGIVAMDKIEKDFGDQVVPVALHSYQGDTFDNPKSRQLAEFLGMTAAPSGRVNRGDIISPLGTDGKGNGSFTNYDPTVPSWYDNVVSELAVPAEANVEVVSYYNDDRSKIHVRSTVTYALDMENVNANIFTVILEDGLNGNQSSNVYGSEDPIFGDWGKGGKYANSSVPYVYNDVVKGWEGTTANGTGGFIPSTVEGGKPYVAEFDIDTPSRVQDKDNVKIATYLINANGGRILNAAVGKVGADGVENVEGLEAETRIVVRGGEISVLTSGAVSAAVYSMDGRMIGAANGIDTLNLNLDGYKGVAVVRVADGNGVKVVKVML